MKPNLTAHHRLRVGSIVGWKWRQARWLLTAAAGWLAATAALAPTPSLAPDPPQAIQGTKLQRVLHVEALPALQGKPGVVIVLENPRGFYIGGLFWVLWAGKTPMHETNTGIAELDKPQAEKNQTRTFILPKGKWETLAQNAPLHLTWGEFEPAPEAKPFARLDKKKAMPFRPPR